MRSPTQRAADGPLFLPPSPPPPFPQSAAKWNDEQGRNPFCPVGVVKRRRFVFKGDKTTSFLIYLFILNKTQNDVVLHLFCPKRRRFGISRFKKKNQQSQNEVVLAQKMTKRRRFDQNPFSQIISLQIFLSTSNYFQFIIL